MGFTLYIFANLLILLRKMWVNLIQVKPVSSQKFFIVCMVRAPPNGFESTWQIAQKDDQKPDRDAVVVLSLLEEH